MVLSLATAAIVQAAFSYAEMSPLSSFGDDSPEAAEAETAYAVLLDAALERADWSFASSLETLPEVTPAVVDDELPYAYSPPTTFLKIREVRGDGIGPLGVAWRRDGTLLRANVPGPLTLRVTVRVTNENLLPGEFKEYVALRLASRLAARFATSANRSQVLADRAERVFETAVRADARQASTRRWDGGEGDFDWAADVAGGLHGGRYL